MTDKLAALIREMKEKHARGGKMVDGFMCSSPDCVDYWPCDAIRLVEVVEDLHEAMSLLTAKAEEVRETFNTALAGDMLTVSLSTKELRAAVSGLAVRNEVARASMARAEEKLAR